MPEEDSGEIASAKTESSLRAVPFPPFTGGFGCWSPQAENLSPYSVSRLARKRGSHSN
jgi:hypothetical protein